LLLITHVLFLVQVKMFATLAMTMLDDVNTINTWVTATSATHYSNTLQHTAMHMAHSKEESGSTCEDTAGSRESDEGNTLQHTTTHCNCNKCCNTLQQVLQHIATSVGWSTPAPGLHTATRTATAPHCNCNVLQQAAV